jgi:outer membrane protein OmpA-like peptidoglycan-associated protein
MLDQEDEGTRIGVWVALSVVFFVIVGVLGGVILRQMHAKAAATAPAAVSVDAAGFIDAPLEGDIVGTVYFALGQSALPDGVQPVLDKAVLAIQEAPQRRVVVSGFHDASGTAAVNTEIAKARAKTVREALTADGVSASRIALRKPAETLGGEEPIEARRVEIRLVD